ncbi:Asp-tRNA(Asn)/Glu-tRNA(Gln) amidotransferase subunit GatA [Thermodesulfatator atlanticus]|uniref:Asp-tRNA(Asn)/Glu-tRNA(Gln) amidotransferase subunit GatA n=1 Tax=Thermodesulfatator atlanticus TaxID=501497 RepID=UPI0003B2F040|nr:Asp-tRNA(Asn)/Glu-tRNA(Gln) amidotransferase subunit GatA [Thermodesulfatator atlanticus]
MDWHKLPLTEQLAKLKAGEVSSVELAKALLSFIEEKDQKIKAFIKVTKEEALKQAEEADERRRKGDNAPLLGVPLAIKDNICIKGVETTCASKMLENFVPPFDATVITKLKEAGAVFLGKTNLDEFAMGSSTENSAFFPTHNPWDVERVPGGSSGGSAAAVAAGFCAGALGSDTGGSIRQPASFCGVVGLKPTYGRVSRYGLVAFASSLDQIGPITRTVKDTALILQVIAGKDPMDSTSVPKEVPNYLEELNMNISGAKIGVPEEYFGEGLSDEVREKIEDALKVFEKLGCQIKKVSLPHTPYAVAAYYIIAPAEASSNLARYDGVKYGLRVEGKDLIDMYKKTRSQGFGPEVKRRIMIGTYALSAGYYDAYYKKASQVRTLISQDFANAFEEVDFIVGPAAPTPAFKIGERISDPLQMYLSDIYTISVNLAGIVALSLPCGFTSQGLPVGMQIMGPHFSETKVLALGHKFEEETKFYEKYPEV